jgi:hypothetical protein
VAFRIGNSQIGPLRLRNVFSRHLDLLGMSYLLLLFDRKDVVADALGIRRRVKDFPWRIGEDLDPMIDIASVAG